MKIRELIQMAEKMAHEYGDDSAEILFRVDGKEPLILEPTGFYLENETTIFLKEADNS